MKQTTKKIVWLVACLGVGTLAGSVGICAEQRTLVHGARRRTYLIHLPVGHDKLKPTTLVFCLHSYSGTGREIEKRTGLSLLADKEGFIAVYPNAVAFGPKRKQMWNGGGAYEIWTRGMNDVGFISALIDELSRVYTIDPARIYAFGHSNGGFMAHHLGARLPNRFAAVACSAGLLARNDFAAGPLVSVIHFHGKRDQSVRYGGIAKRDWSGVEEGISLWVKRNRCSSKAEILREDNQIRVRKWASPRRSGEVVLVELKAWGHKLAKKDKGAPITAVEEAWKFFKSHPKINVTLRSSEKIEGEK
ncbi:MAG: prolyl oligopeptidase family serine peptidase [Planctomycetes bacterium]|nr:prolyl oligopeptidase family serine peptidase [Planctomycetota bacterium]